MPQLDATTGGASANSYATVAAAQDYIDTLVPSTLADAWNDAGEEDQGKALMMATRQLNTWFNWFGSQTSLDQALPWPRIGVLKPNVAEGGGGGSVTNPWHKPFGTLLNQNEVPQGIVEVTAELARQLLTGDRLSDSQIETQGLRGLTAGPVSLEFAGGVMAKPVPDSVVAMASHYGTLHGRTGSGAVTLYRA